jgi:antirestriction protein
MSTLTNTPRIYVGTYAKYNNGSIQGAWLDLDDYTDAEDFYNACKELHSDEPDPEFMFQDFEGFPKQFYSESGSVDEIYEYIDFVQKSHLDQDVIDAGLDCDIAMENIEEAYSGKYSSDKDFAQQFAEEIGVIDKNASWPNTCIDWEQAARELMYDYNSSNNYYFRIL